MNINIIDSDTQQRIEEKINNLKQKERDIRESFIISNEQVYNKCKSITEKQLFDYLHLENVYLYFNHVSALCKILTRTNKEIIPHLTYQNNTDFKDFLTNTFSEIEKYEDNFLNLEEQNLLWWSNAKESFYIIPKNDHSLIKPELI
jgi:chloramphenicol O-acetyltransferase